MARILPRSLANARHLLLGLLAIAFVLRIGGACEAMAAIPSAPAAHEVHCADLPGKPDKPVKSDAAACASCVALPVAIPARAGATSLATLSPVASLTDTLAGLASGPAPPPPKSA
ncbi:hypothetical protein [Sphingomonas japonica]|uniref:DUF2946 domain-containing protein n=1 Tax=Sphingomonas japonica TaxID=511662 RepID=A0ABX0TW14_9SPHN|nr:hypothetical protein [Sphingomonas japonica]NIJ22509.1 hypothetical protein [Sphingomonas japonica]